MLLPELGAAAGIYARATVRFRVGVGVWGVGTWEDYECQINVNYKLPIKEAIKTGSTGPERNKVGSKKESKESAGVLSGQRN